jgi:hypothetical protein
MISIDYNYLFTVELLHKYFASGLCNDFTIIPSSATQASLANNRILVKQYGNKLYAGMQVDELSGVPLIVPAKDVELTFYLQLNNPLFINYTNLPTSYAAGRIYYFTNRNNNVQNGKNFISKFAVYSSAVTYHPGDIVTDVSHVVFQCIASCTAVSPSIANSNNWMKIDNNQYLSVADQLQWLPSVSTYTFTTPQSGATINVWAYDTATSDYTNNIITENISFANPSSNFTLDLSTLTAGKYLLQVNGSNKQGIYINDELKSTPAFAVLDIFNDDNLAAGYKLLDGVTHTLQSPLYSISFLNRATIWKYILTANSKGHILVNPTNYHFPASPANTMYSLAPIPLSETPLNVSLKLSTINNHPVNPAINVSSVACASPQVLSNYTNGTDKYPCSEIFLNY